MVDAASGAVGYRVAVWPSVFWDRVSHCSCISSALAEKVEVWKREKVFVQCRVVFIVINDGGGSLFVEVFFVIGKFHRGKWDHRATGVIFGRGGVNCANNNKLTWSFDPRDILQRRSWKKRKKQRFL